MANQTAFWLLLLIICFGVLPTTINAKQQISILNVEDPRNQLIVDIFELALDNSAIAGNYEFTTVKEQLTEARIVDFVEQGKLTVAWLGTQLSYEERLKPIRIPILKGMLGHRIFIIRAEDQPRFDRVNSIEDLKRIPLGQGRFWGDTKVLREANMRVVDPVKYESLFHMLEGGRFDFFPRALHEPWNEVSRWSNLNLAIENKILLVYPFALYFFVSHDNPEMAQLIEAGFRQAINNGSYNQLFFNDPTIKQTLQQSNLKQRKVFRLENPFMHAKTPIDDKALWLDLDNLK